MGATGRWRHKTTVCSASSIDGLPFLDIFGNMKTAFAILLSFIISQAPVLAIHGGYTLGGAQSVTGTYAGVLIPITDTVINSTVTTGTTTTSGSTSTVTGFGTNTLGLFTLSIPDVGVGAGQILIFASGQNLSGSIQALPDPSNPGSIIGIIQATGVIEGSASTVNFAFLFVDLTGEAGGEIQAAVEASNNSNSPTGAIITGTAGVTFSTIDAFGALTPVEQATYDVEGLQQTTSAPASSGTL